MTDQELKKLAASLAADNKETDRQFKETDRRLRLLSEQIEALGNKFGGFTEIFPYPSLYRILKDEFQLPNVDYRCRRQRHGREQEFDMVGSGNASDQRVVLAEIKSHLTETELKKFEKKLREFFDFFPEQRGKTLYGLIAAVDLARGLAERVARRGLYLAVAHDGNFTLTSPARFKPKRFG